MAKIITKHKKNVDNLAIRKLQLKAAILLVTEVTARWMEDMKAPPSPIRPSNDASSSPALPVQPASKSGTTTNLAKKDLNTSTPLQKEHEPERMQKEEAKSGVEVIDFTGWSETAAVVQTPAPLAHVGRVEPTPPTQPKDGSVLPPQATDESTPTPVSLARTLDFPV